MKKILAITLILPIIFSSAFFILQFSLLPSNIKAFWHPVENLSIHLTSTKPQFDFSILASQAAYSIAQVNDYVMVPIYQIETKQSKGRKFLTTKQVGTRKEAFLSGSAFLFHSDGYLLTNNHVVPANSTEYTVSLKGMPEIPARVIYRDSAKDLAILKIDGENFYTIKLAKETGLSVGEQVAGLGYRINLPNRLPATGTVSALDQQITAADPLGKPKKLSGLIEGSVPLMPGDSGGPLINNKGEVVGINAATNVSGPTASYFIPVEEANKIIEKLQLNT